MLGLGFAGLLLLVPLDAALLAGLDRGELDQVAGLAVRQREREREGVALVGGQGVFAVYVTLVTRSAAVSAWSSSDAEADGSV